VDSDPVVETLLSRRLIAEDPRFGGRGRPGFLVTTPIFMRTMGLASLTELPPRPGPGNLKSGAGGNAGRLTRRPRFSLASVL
jgi:chromosome segregation and condensation protein ScpB